MSDIFHWPLSNGQEVCDYDDHARIVAEEVAAAEQRIRSDAGVIQAAHDIGQRGYDEGYERGKAEAEARWVEIARQDRMAAHQRGAQEAERQHAKALADMEQAHAAALADVRVPAWQNGYDAGYKQARGDAEVRRVVEVAAAAAPRTLTRDGWWPFGSFVDYDFPLEFDGEGEDGLPIWERPDKSRLAPRTLTALMKAAIDYLETYSGNAS